MKAIHLNILKGLISTSVLFVLLSIFASCSQEVDVKQSFDYEIKMQKYRTDVEVDKPVSLVFFIKNTGNYSDVNYSVNYFLRTGSGRLSNQENQTLLDNTQYEIQGDILRVSYLPTQKGDHTIEVEFSDNFNQRKEIIINLSAD